MSEPKLGKIYVSNDKLFTGMKKKRNVVVSNYSKESKKYGVSRILSLEGKEGKSNTLLPLKDNYSPVLKKASGVDYYVYRNAFDKNGKRTPINFGAMKDTNMSLSKKDLNAVLHHVKKRGGRQNYGKHKNYLRHK